MATGFKAGLEIHAQLAGKKLFCNCPTDILDTAPDLQLMRRLRAVVGETGEIDKAAAYEQMKGKYFIYHFYDHANCLIDIDEAPPNPMHQFAIKTAIKVAQFLNAKIVDEIQVMRKTVIDGSNVSGFQRTALIARNGWLDTSQGKVSIPSIALEEDAAKKVKDTKTSTSYNLSRLGIPLLEIATGPDLKSPEHAKEAAQKIGLILRSVPHMRRGIGTIRQDVNVSIAKGARVEIKGFQDVRSIPIVLQKEVERQKKLIKQGKKTAPEVRKAEPDNTTSYLRPLPGAARLYPETDVIPFKIPKAWLAEKKIESIEQRAKRYEKMMGKDLALKLAKSDKIAIFEQIIKHNKKIKPSFVAETLIGAAKSIQRQYNITISPAESDFVDLFNALNKGTIVKDSVMDILKENKPVKQVLKKYAVMSDKELEKALRKIIKQNKGLPLNALIGKAMALLKGKAEGKKIVALLQRLAHQ